MLFQAEASHESSYDTRDYESYDSEYLLPTGRVQIFLSYQLFALYEILNII